MNSWSFYVVFFLKFQDALAKASNVTVVHLVKVTRNAKVSTARVPLSLAENKGEELTRN